MSAIDKLQLEKEIARLDGFLAGLALRNGAVKDYSSGAYFIEPKSGCSIVESLKERYEWMPSLTISNVKRLQRGMRDLEPAIRPFLAHHIPCMNVDEVLNLQRHLSFMVMEIISSAMGGDYSGSLDVFHMSSAHEPMASRCDYFCICLEGFLIFLQFNDDTEFVSRPSAMVT